MHDIDIDLAETSINFIKYAIHTITEKNPVPGNWLYYKIL